LHNAKNLNQKVKMKLLSAIILTLAVMAVRVPAQTASTNEPPELRAILHLCAERRLAHTMNARIVIDHGKVIQFRLYPADYLRAIKAINTDACPRSIQLAWFDYVTAWEDRQRTAQRQAGEAVIDIIRLGTPGAVSAGEDLIKLSENDGGTADAWRKVERAALEMGYDISKR
jgi:hypothetical protein